MFVVHVFICNQLLIRVVYKKLHISRFSTQIFIFHKNKANTRNFIMRFKKKPPIKPIA